MGTIRSLTMVMLLAACSSTSEPASAAGDYALVSINDHALPASGGARMVVSSTLSLHANGTLSFARVDSFPLTPNTPNKPFSVDGTWSRSGNDLTMFYGSEQKLTSAFFGALIGTQLIVQQPDEGVWVYSRR
jgi:hypothetical protein